MHEGPQAVARFNETMQKLLAVPHDELKRREAEYRRQVEANPNRRGPKRKVKSSGRAKGA
jgi:hypothetical protein